MRADITAPIAITATASAVAFVFTVLLAPTPASAQLDDLPDTCGSIAESFPDRDSWTCWAESDYATGRPGVRIEVSGHTLTSTLLDAARRQERQKLSKVLENLAAKIGDENRDNGFVIFVDRIVDVPGDHNRDCHAYVRKGVGLEVDKREYLHKFGGGISSNCDDDLDFIYFETLVALDAKGAPAVGPLEKLLLARHSDFQKFNRYRATEYSNVWMAGLVRGYSANVILKLVPRFENIPIPYYTYRTKGDESLRLIAKDQFGDESLWPILLSMNAQEIGSSGVAKSGVDLKLPVDLVWPKTEAWFGDAREAPVSELSFKNYGEFGKEFAPMVQYLKDRTVREGIMDALYLPEFRLDLIEGFVGLGSLPLEN